MQYTERTYEHDATGSTYRRGDNLYVEETRHNVANVYGYGHHKENASTVRSRALKRARATFGPSAHIAATIGETYLRGVAGQRMRYSVVLIEYPQPPARAGIWHNPNVSHVQNVQRTARCDDWYNFPAAQEALLHGASYSDYIQSSMQEHVDKGHYTYQHAMSLTLGAALMGNDGD